MTKQITPLRQRMLDDMALRNMSPATQRVYINAVKNFSEPGKPFKPNRKRYYVGVTVRNRSDTVGEFAGLAESSTYVGKSARIVASIRTETGSLSFLAQP
jgi:hypothetical protein